MRIWLQFDVATLAQSGDFYWTNSIPCEFNMVHRSLYDFPSGRPRESLRWHTKTHIHGPNSALKLRLRVSIFPPFSDINIYDLLTKSHFRFRNIIDSFYCISSPNYYYEWKTSLWMNYFYYLFVKSLFHSFIIYDYFARDFQLKLETPTHFCDQTE